MSNVLIVSCRLCLEPDELTSMVTTGRELGSPIRVVGFSICRPCARAIAGELQALDSDYTQEVSGDVEAGNQSARGSASDLDDRSGIPTVGDDQTHTAAARATDANSPSDVSGGEDAPLAPKKG